MKKFNVVTTENVEEGLQLEINVQGGTSLGEVSEGLADYVGNLQADIASVTLQLNGCNLKCKVNKQGIIESTLGFIDK